jgi:glycosyltransferase involved in cell wall biosynthesis
MISVCMATYNGLQHISEQLRSILLQLGPEDEVIIVDDCSSDGTWEWLALNVDPRLRVSSSDKNQGHVRTFARALELAQGEWILLSDQDDVWRPGRVSAMVAALRNYPAVASNFTEFGGISTQIAPLRAEDGGRGLRNTVGIFLGRRAYFGSAMGLRRELLNVVLPFPRFVEAHDLWIALCANSLGGIAHLESSTVMRRVHGSNLTPRSRRPPSAVVATRLKFGLALCVLLLRRTRRLFPQP